MLLLLLTLFLLCCSFFFFNDTANTDIYTDGHPLSLHDSLPIFRRRPGIGSIWLRRAFETGFACHDILSKSGSLALRAAMIEGALLLFEMRIGPFVPRKASPPFL